VLKAAAAITGAPAAFSTEQKLLQLWKEHGIAPAEAAEMAMRDRTLAAALASDSDKLPRTHAEAAREAPAAGAEPRPPSSPKDGPAQGERSAAAAEDRPGAASRDAPAAEPERTGSSPAVDESRAIGAFDPPRLPQRPFESDYPKPPPAMADGRLRVDMEGRPLDAYFVAGRRFAGKGDRALSQNDIKTALPPLGIRLFEMPVLPAGSDKTVGLYTGHNTPKGPRGAMFVKSTMSAEDRRLVLGHEFGHAIDHYARYLSRHLTQDEIGELRKVYATLRSEPGTAPKRRPQPESFGYDTGRVNRELVAEGLRAYMTNPNYFKTAAPRAAARIRALVNKNKHLKHIIQFNSLAAAALIGAGAAAGRPDDQDQDQ
jgi:hypothetical protein